MQEFDVVIVGAGSAGCALAARLSENPSRRVLLLDAGPDYVRLEKFPDELARAGSLASSFPGHPNNWSFVGEITPGRNYPLPRGRVVGGSSAVNGTYFIRGRREDFEQWVALGNPLWSYDQVLPFYKKSETDLDFDDEFHGRSGPMPVRRAGAGELHPVSAAFTEACLALGYPEDPDKNAPTPDGIGPIPRNAVNGQRMNTAVTYLAQARDRPNLTVLGYTYVRRVLIAGGRAVGVEADRGGEVITYPAGEVVLSASGFKTPQLLMLSGIGPADHLREHGLSVVHDSPGVGQDIQDHPSIAVQYRAAEQRVRLAENFVPIEVCLNYSSPEATVSGDLQIMCFAAPLSRMLAGSDRWSLPSYLRRPLRTLNGLRRLDRRMVLSQARHQDNLMLLCSLDAEASKGRIELSSPDPTVAPRIALNYLSDPADLPRIRHNVRLALEILGTAPLRALGAELVQPAGEDLADDATLDAWIRTNIGTSFHTTGSARMGPDSDPKAVVDEYCRVRGVEGLRVADISIMPTIVRRGPAATAVMIGERVADLITTSA